MKNREILFIIKLRNEARRQTRAFGKDLNRLARDATAASKGVARLQKQTKTAARQAKEASRNFNVTGRSLRSLRVVAIAASAALAALGVGIGISSLVQDFAEFDRGLIGVSKTTNIAGEDLDRLGDAIQRVSREVPQSTGQLLAIAQAAGQLGVQGVDNIVKFTETVGKLGLATNLAGDEAATSLARILTVTGEPTQNVDRLGAAIVDLGNNFAATEREIAGAGLRVGRATAQFDVTSAAAVGIGAALSAVGVRAEEGGTVIGRAFLAIDAAIRGGGLEFERLQEITGKTAEQLKRDFADTPTVVFRQLVEGLGQVRNAGGSVAGALSDLGLEGVRVIGTLGTLATRSDVLGAALDRSNQAFRENTALNEEAARAAQSFTAQLKLTRTAISEAAVVLGDELVPFVLDAAKGFREFILEAKDTGAIERGVQRAIEVVRVLARVFELLVVVAKGFIALRLGTFLLTLAKSARAAGVSMTFLAIGTSKAAVAAKALTRALVFGLAIEGVTVLAGLFRDQLSKEVAEGVNRAQLFGAAFVGVFKAIGGAIGTTLAGLADFARALFELRTGNISAAIEAAREGIATLADVRVDIAGAIEAEFIKLAEAAAERARMAGEDAADELAGGIRDGADEIVAAGADAGRQFSDAFTDAVEALGGADAFTKSLDSIVKAFRPGIAATKQQEQAIKVLDVALLASESRLKRFGLTLDDVRALREQVTVAAKNQLGPLEQEIRTQQQAIALLGVDRNERAARAQVIALENRLLAEQGRVDQRQLDRLEALINQRRQLAAAEALRLNVRQNIIPSIQQEIALLGASEEVRRRIVAVEGLRRQAQAAGVMNIQAEVEALNAQFDALEVAEAALRADPFAGARAGLEDFTRAATDFNTQFRDATRGTLDEVTGAFNEFVATGKFNFADLTSSILASFQKIATNFIFQQILGAGGGFPGLGAGGGGGGFLSSIVGFGSGGGLLGSLFSKGGTVGRDGTPAILAADAFKNARRFQRGGPISSQGADRVPILAAPGEVVLTAGQADVLRSALAGRGVGSLGQPAQVAQAGAQGGLTAAPVVQVTMIVEGVRDVQGFRENTGAIAAEAAQGINRALQRNG